MKKRIICKKISCENTGIICKKKITHEKESSVKKTLHEDKGIICKESEMKKESSVKHVKK